MIVEAFPCPRPVQTETMAQAQFVDLWQSAWAYIRQENNGAPNLVGTADMMFQRLREENPGWQAPERDVFVKETVAAALDPEIFKYALYPGAREAVRVVADKGPVTIWSQGDVHGGVGRSGTSWAGSEEQITRISGSGVLTHNNDGLHPFRVAAAEDKFPLLRKELMRFAYEGVRNVVVMDDKLGNLQKVAQLIAEHYPLLKVHLVWVRQGPHGNYGAEPPDGIISLRNISDMKLLIDSLQLENPGFLLDFDGVLSEDELRQYYQQMSVFRHLTRLGWLKGTQYEDPA